MDETKSVRCEGDVRKLTHFFESLACTSSPDTRNNSEIINQKVSAGSGDTKSRGLVRDGLFFLDNVNGVPCKECFNSHFPFSVCPFIERPCYICDKFHQDFRSVSVHCPYEEHLPQGATFNPGYEVVCRCGNLFNEDKWVCTSCGGNRAKLQIKHCGICNVFGEHDKCECPKDPVEAASYKSVIDGILSRGPPEPYKFVIPSSGTYPEYAPTGY